MKTFMALIFLAVCVLVALSYQAVQQEFRIRGMKAQITSVMEQVKTKEDEIVSAKLKIQQINEALSPLIMERDQLGKKKEEVTKSKVDSDANLATCKTQKEDAEKKKTEVTAALEKLKNQQAEEQKVQEEINVIQKQILDRDIKICAFVDKQQEEGRKFCEGKTATQ